MANISAGLDITVRDFFLWVFCLFLIVTNSQVRFICLALALTLLILAGSVIKPTSPVVMTYTSPLLLEFLAGATLGYNLRRILAAPVGVGVGLLVVGGLGLFISPEINTPDVFRVLLLGGPALMLVAGSLCLERWLRRRPSKVLTYLGNASYSLYLTHPLAISAVAVAWAHTGAERTLPISSFIPAALASALAVGGLTHSYIELWLQNRLRGRKGPRTPNT